MTREVSFDLHLNCGACMYLSAHTHTGTNRHTDTPQIHWISTEKCCNLFNPKRNYSDSLIFFFELRFKALNDS